MSLRGWSRKVLGGVGAITAVGHHDYKTASIYVDYAPDPSEGAHYAARAFQTHAVASLAMTAGATDSLAPTASPDKR